MKPPSVSSSSEGFAPWWATCSAIVFVYAGYTSFAYKENASFGVQMASFVARVMLLVFFCAMIVCIIGTDYEYRLRRLRKRKLSKLDLFDVAPL